MDLIKNGKLLHDLRKAKGMTQKQVADILAVLPKTVSKWETGHGFPDVSFVSSLADIFGVSERMILSGSEIKNSKDIGNIKKTKFYICQNCGAFIQGVGESSVVCCGKPLKALTAKKTDENHSPDITDIENDYYIEFNHEMTKDHYISFVSYVGFDRVLTVRMYPEQSSSVRFPKMYRGKMYFYCTNHGLFEYLI